MTNIDLQLDPSSPEPLFRQLAQAIRREMARGALQPGDRLPTVRELAARTRVNRNTAARAVQTLEAEGLVHTRVGRGTFVAGNGDLARIERERTVDRALRQLLDQARAVGFPASELPARLERLLRAEDEDDR